MKFKEKSNLENLEFCNNKINNYTTARLIIDLKNELQNYPIELAEISRYRLQCFKDYWLSELWGFSKKYVHMLRIKIKEDNKFSINIGALLKLKKIIEKKDLGSQIILCLKLIDLYKNGNLSGLEFLDLLKLELGKISGLISVTFEELGLILTGSTRFITAVLDKIQNHYPDYKFTQERLEQFKEYLVEILGQKSNICLKLIEKYKNSNPNLKLYFNQQFRIKHYDYFKDMVNQKRVANFYWFGLLCADGWLIGENNNKNYYRIGIELSYKDINLIIKFSKAIGLDIKRIKKRYRFLRNECGKLNKHLMAYIIFGCKPMYLDLVALGMRKVTSKVNPKLKEIPPIITNLIKKAKYENLIIKIKSRQISWYYTSSGKLTLAWLLGFYDGDGHHAGGKSASITSSSIFLLEQIKDKFEIKNKVRNYITSISLQLGPMLFDAMMWTYIDSLKRKRKNLII